MLSITHTHARHCMSLFLIKCHSCTWYSPTILKAIFTKMPAIHYFLKFLIPSSSWPGPDPGCGAWSLHSCCFQPLHPSFPFSSGTKNSSPFSIIAYSHLTYHLSCGIKISLPTSSNPWCLSALTVRFSTPLCFLPCCYSCFGGVPLNISKVILLSASNTFLKHSFSMTVTKSQARFKLLRCQGHCLSCGPIVF